MNKCNQCQQKGATLVQAGDRIGAIAAFREAVSLDPNNAEAWCNLGASLKGIALPHERINCYHRSLEIKNDPHTRSNLASALLEAGEWLQASVEAYLAVEVMPDYVPAWINLALARGFLGDHAGAENAYHQAKRLDPQNADAFHGLGTLYIGMQRFEEAEEILAAAEMLQPENHKIGVVAARARQQIADWSKFAKDRGRIIQWIGQALVGLPPFNLLSIPGITGRQHKANAATHAKAEFGPFFVLENQRSRKNLNYRLRVGYLTADLRMHVIGRLMGPILQQSADRTHDVFVYDILAGKNPLKTTLLPHVSAWRDVSRKGVHETAAQIAADGIDILVDMSGYTGYGRSAVLACRPAPIQVNYLGYPASLGDQRLADYIITDSVTSPVDHSDHYAEKLAWLPGCLLPPTIFGDLIPNVSRSKFGLPQNGLVLAAFHNGYKLNPEIFSQWVKILQALPGAILWLLAPTAKMQARIQGAAQGYGCPLDRLYFYTGGTYKEYLSALLQADLFLDAQPYGAGGTARDVLMLGLPMVTVLGKTFVGRMSASACLTAGVPECVAPSIDEYAAHAIMMAKDENLRVEIKKRLLLSGQTAEVQISRFAQDLALLYQAMADQYALAESTDHILQGAILRVLFEDTEITTARTFLHIGCGPKQKDQTTRGFNTPQWQEVRLDIDASVNPDITGTMTDMSGVADASVDAVFSSHNIEHLYPHEVPRALAEFIRVLRPQGFLIVTCPDLQSVCALVAEDKLTEAAYIAPAGPIAPLDILYGHRASMTRGNLFMAHRCGFTQKVLTGTLQAHGFANTASLRRGHPYYDIWAVASKHPVDENTLRQLAMEHFPAQYGSFNEIKD